MADSCGNTKFQLTNQFVEQTIILITIIIIVKCGEKIKFHVGRFTYRTYVIRD